MATPVLSENRQLRKRLLKLEDEVTVLRERNFHIQRLSDHYRMKVSQFVASIHGRSNHSVGMTEEELSALLHRLRSDDISPNRPAGAGHAAVDGVGAPSPRKLLSREDDDGLMHSTSTLSHATGAEEAPGPSGPQTAREAPAAATGAQRRMAGQLAAENRRLAALVDALKVRLATAARHEAALERKLRATREDPRSSGGGGATANAFCGSSAAQQRRRDMQRLGEQVRREQENARECAREAAHYRTLLERQGAEVEAARQRTKAAQVECAQCNEKYVKEKENVGNLKTSLRLSRLRERRATNALSQLQNQRKGSQTYQEQAESCENNCEEPISALESRFEELKAETMHSFTEMWTANLVRQYELLQEQVFATYIAHMTLATFSVAPGATVVEIMGRVGVEAQKKVQAQCDSETA